MNTLRTAGQAAAKPKTGSIDWAGLLTHLTHYAGDIGQGLLQSGGAVKAFSAVYTGHDKAGALIVTILVMGLVLWAYRRRPGSRPE